jgi:hypothetical protein
VQPSTARHRDLTGDRRPDRIDHIARAQQNVNAVRGTEELHRHGRAMRDGLDAEAGVGGGVIGVSLPFLEGGQGSVVRNQLNTNRLNPENRPKPWSSVTSCAWLAIANAAK